MAYSKYLNDPLDERYLLEPGEYVEEGAIPDEELEVRKQLAALKLCEDRLRKCGFFWRLFNSEEYKGYLHIAKTVNDNLMNLVNKTPAGVITRQTKRKFIFTVITYHYFSRLPL